MRRPVFVPQVLVLVVALAVAVTVLRAQGGAAPNLTAAEPMGPVENLTTYPAPPEGFNVARADIPHGEVKLVEYESKTLGVRRPLRVYTPPGYSTARRYPCSIYSTGWAIPAPNGSSGRGRRSSPTT
jgi:enterochelin esterase-like enzyme